MVFGQQYDTASKTESLYKLTRTPAGHFVVNAGYPLPELSVNSFAMKSAVSMRLRDTIAGSTWDAVVTEANHGNVHYYQGLP